jgi:hypothetical protein
MRRSIIHPPYAMRFMNGVFKDPLARLNEAINWDTFLPILNENLKPERKGLAGLGREYD